MNSSLGTANRDRFWATPVALASAVFAYSALEAMLVPALPSIQQDLGASTPAITWVFTGLLFAGAVSTPVICRLAEIADKRRVLIGVLLVVTVGVLVSATSSSVIQLAVGQILQGPGLGLPPLAVALLRDTQPAERLRSANGLIVGASGLAAASGLLAAGLIISVLPFTWLYWIPLAVLIVTLALVWRLVPACPPTARGSVDWRGAVLLATGLLALLLGVTIAPEAGWTSARFLGLIAIAVVVLVLFVRTELRTTHPLVEIRGFLERPVLLTCAVSFVVGFGTFAVYVLVPNLASTPASTGYGLGASTVVVGMLLLPLGVFGAISAPLTPHVERFLGARGTMVFSTALIVSTGPILLLAYGNAWALYLASAVCGVGVGIGLTQSMNIVVSVVPEDRTASVSGTAYVLKNVGSTLGAQIGASLLASNHMPGSSIPSWNAYATAFVVSAAVSAVALVLSFGLPSRLAMTSIGTSVRTMRPS